MDKKKILLVVLPLLMAAQTGSKAEVISGELLTWDDAVAVMFRANPQNLSSQARKEQYRQKILAAENILYPQAGLTGAYTRTSPAGGYEENYNYGFTASYSLYNPAGRSDIRQSRLDLSQVEQDDILLENKLYYLLRQAFSQLLYAQNSLTLSEQTLQRRQDNAALLRLKYNAGRESRAALLETDALVQSAVWDRDKNLKNVRA
ncbi:MAG: TolC family protein, partial [Elusimicrobiaceae bacterium]|nr:TolC family protein [Elusimicrobiaceae bacterium]